MKVGFRETWRDTLRRHPLFFYIVVLPFAVSALYLYGFAADRYVGEAQFVVQSVGGGQTLTGLAALFTGQGAGISDAPLLKARIQSPDMMDTLNSELHILSHWAAPKADVVSRLWWPEIRERAFQYYLGHISVGYDEAFHLITVKAEAYDPEMAKRIVEAILRHSEAFVNAAGHQVAEEQVKFVLRHVEETRSRLDAARAQILKFQDTHGSVDPSSEVAARSQLIASLEADIARVRAEMNKELAFLDSKAPKIAAYQSQIRALEQQVRTERAKLTGADQTQARMNAVTDQFKTLEMDAELAVAVHRGALESLEAARVEASRKLKQLLVVSVPGLPQYPLLPKRLYNLLAIGIGLLLLYGVVSLLRGIIRDHRH